MTWEDVEAAIPQAKSIAYDGCHKIYLLMDDTQTALMIAVGYQDNDTEGGARLFTLDEISPEIALAQLHTWFDNSCGLKFISSVKTVEGDPNEGFTHLISQFEYEDQEDDD